MIKLKNFLDKNFSRRNFLSNSAKILTGAAVFGLMPSADAKKRLRVPQISELKALDELDIGTVPLEFGEMDLRTHTGAIVLHHTGMRDMDMTVAEIHDLHKNQNKWSGIGYHFLIHKDGYIERGRPENTLGAHSLSNNEFTVGICVIGNYDIGVPTKEQIISAEQLMAALCDKYKFEPSDTTIFGHRDLCPTSCPGKSLYSLLPEMIENVQKVF